MPDDVTESVATHSSKLQLSIICMPQDSLDVRCSGGQIHEPEDRDEGSSQS